MPDLGARARHADPRAGGHAQLGLWLFLGSEALLFAGLFGSYAVCRVAFAADFGAGMAHNHARIGTTGTLVLIASSIAVAWSIQALRSGRPRACIGALACAIALGGTFLGLRFGEYAEHFAEGIAPGAHYALAALPSQGARTFFALYYGMTALHALHALAGVAILCWLALRVARGRITAERPTVLELGGLYWQLVDLGWLLQWPLLYPTS